MKIQIKIQNNYGRESIYPVCETSEIFAKIAGTKTLTRETLGLIKKLGYTIELIQQQLHTVNY
jgi:hypothetical protein